MEIFLFSLEFKKSTNFLITNLNYHLDILIIVLRFTYNPQIFFKFPLNLHEFFILR